MAVEDNLQITTFEQLATLLSQVAQNNTNLSLTYFNMFYNTTPQDITLRLYNTDGVLQEFTVPNRAKDFNYIKNGSGSPQGVITANVGTLYQDTLNGTLYIKSVGTDAQGWVEIANNDLIRTGNNNPNGIVVAPQGTLYINVSTSTLYIKSTSTGSNGWIQVNANLSNVANVDLSNISSTAQGNIRNAITGGASTIAGTNLTASKALVSDGYGKVSVSDTTSTELEVLHNMTASTAELNVLDGITANTTELNYTSGVTSNIQTQINAKESISNKITTISSSSTDTQYPSAKAVNTGLETRLNKQQITNCILEDPQNIKLELNNGTLTLKAGSVVCVPNGFESDGTTPKFDEVEIESDVSKDGSGLWTSQCLVVYNQTTNNLTIVHVNACFSGTSYSSEGMYYRTDLNTIRYYNGSSVVDRVLSFPVALINISSNVITSIDQTFQSIGYIGSTVFVRKGLKGLAPNGFNSDGSLRNNEIISTKVYTRTFTNTYNNNRYIVFTPERVGYPISLEDNDIYNDETNTFSDNNVAGLGFYCAKCTLTNGVISNFKPYTAANILKYSDKSQISGWGMPSNKAIALTLGASGSTYTAPANGWFKYGAKSTSATSYMTFGNSNICWSQAGWSFGNMVAVKKGDVVTSWYLNITDAFILFIYAEGETN